VNKLELAKAVRDVASDLQLSKTDAKDEIANAFEYLASLIEAIDEEVPTPELGEPKTAGFKFTRNDIGEISVAHNGIRIGEIQPPSGDDKFWTVVGHGLVLSRYRTRNAAVQRLLTIHTRGY
jgi:hypothetical protein